LDRRLVIDDAGQMLFTTNTTLPSNGGASKASSNSSNGFKVAALDIATNQWVKVRRFSLSSNRPPWQPCAST
jgi:hypothetical protein